MNQIRSVKIKAYSFSGQKNTTKSKNYILNMLNTTETKVTSGILFVLVMLMAFLKRKSIGKYLEKGVKTVNDSVKTVLASSIKYIKKDELNKPIKITNKKFELPKPIFTCGEENPKQLAKEKAEYIKNIWDISITTIDTEKRLAGLEAIEKYGRIEDIEKLAVSYRKGQNDAERIAFAKAVAGVGKGRDSFWSMGILRYAESDDAKIKILDSIITTLHKEKAIFPKHGYCKIIKDFLQSPNKQIRELAQKAYDLIELE